MLLRNAATDGHCISHMNIRRPISKALKRKYDPDDLSMKQLPEQSWTDVGESLDLSPKKKRVLTQIPAPPRSRATSQTSPPPLFYTRLQLLLHDHNYPPRNRTFTSRCASQRSSPPSPSRRPSPPLHCGAAHRATSSSASHWMIRSMCRARIRWYSVRIPRRTY